MLSRLFKRGIRAKSKKTSIFIHGEIFEFHFTEENDFYLNFACNSIFQIIIEFFKLMNKFILFYVMYIITMVSFSVILLLFSSISIIWMFMNRTSTSVVAFFVGGFINLSYPEGMQIVLKHFFEVTKLKWHKKTILLKYMQFSWLFSDCGQY